MGVESLLHRILLDIQHAVIYRCFIASETCLCFREETRRDIRVHVVEPSFREFRQDSRGRRSCTRPDFDHPEASVVGQPRHKSLNRFSQQPVRRTRHRSFPIQIPRGRVSAAEQDRQRVRSAQQHVCQGVARPLKKPDLGQAVGIQLSHSGSEFLGVRRHFIRQGIPGSDSHDESAVCLLQHPGLGQHLEHPAEQFLMLLHDIQAPPQVL